MLSRNFFEKMVWSGAIWDVPKYVITSLKINNFKGKNQQDNLITLFLLSINLDEHVSTKINTFRIYKVGGWGGGGGGGGG